MNNEKISFANGRLSGLGHGDSISIDKLDDLFKMIGKNDVVQVLSNTITAIGCLHAKANSFEENVEAGAFIEDEIKPLLHEVDLYNLNQILKFFNS